MPTKSIASALNENASSRSNREESNTVDQIMDNTSQTNNDDNNQVATFVVTPNIQGEIDQSDVSTPRVKISQAMSRTLHENGIKPGHVALGDTYDLGPSFNAIFAGFRKFYTECLDYGSDQKPKIWDTQKELEGDGYTLSWNSSRPRAEVVGDIQFLIQAPKGDKSGLFTKISKSSGSWAPAMFTAKATNYRTLAKSLLTAAAMGHLRGNLLQGLWSIEVEEHSNGKNHWYALKPIPAGSVDVNVQRELAETFQLGG